MNDCIEHITNSIVSLFLHLKGNSRQRLLSKFSENNFEKIERLLELFQKYARRVQAVDERYQELDDSDRDDEEIYLERLDAGLFTLQLVCLLLAYAISTSEEVWNFTHISFS
jgi:beta-catenin-like protein 1